MSSCAVIDESNSVFGETDIKAISPIKKQPRKNHPEKLLIRSGSIASKQSTLTVAENKEKDIKSHNNVTYQTPGKNTTQPTCAINSTNQSNKAMPPSTCLLDEKGTNEKKWRKLQIMNDSSEKLKYEKSKSTNRENKQIPREKKSQQIPTISDKVQAENPRMKNTGENPRMKNTGGNLRMENAGENLRMKNAGENPQMKNAGEIPQMKNAGENPRMKNAGENVSAKIKTIEKLDQGLQKAKQEGGDKTTNKVKKAAEQNISKAKQVHEQSINKVKQVAEYKINKVKETEDEIIRLQRKMVKLQNKISHMQSRVVKLQTKTS